jgi:RNA polymerase sigma-70 factor (ECF subfamily)
VSGLEIDLGEAFRRHRGALARAAARVLCHRDDLEDLVQDAFVEALRGIHNLRRPAALRAWLTRVTVRVAQRRLTGRRFVPLDDVPEAEISDGAASPADRVLLAALDEMMAAVPAEQRRAWTLRYLDGEPLDDIAARCCCSVATVKRRIADVQAMLAHATADPPARSH